MFDGVDTSPDYFEPKKQVFSKNNLGKKKLCWASRGCKSHYYCTPEPIPSVLHSLPTNFKQLGIFANINSYKLL